MHLKSLEIVGFKSFPDRTLINFNQGITAIVGPNGSGKSNVSDAVRWVLGEQSAKAIRASKTEDVVFDGSQDRKPLGYAEVSLTIDNSDHTLNLDYSEITVTRRYYRSGESEYLINKTPARLKDIHELFMDTGLGRDGYSLIGQGRIGEILSVKSEDRRQIFEEAAGISKYRYKKMDAERKLLSTEDNLSRVRDILTELEGRVGPLKLQSEKAKKYLELRDEKKGLEITSWLGTVDEIKSGMQKLEIDILTATNTLELASNETERFEKEIDSLFMQAQKASADMDSLRTNIEEKSEEKAQHNTKLSVLENDAEHNKKRSLAILEELTGESFKQEDIDKAICDKQNEIENIKEEIKENQAELEKIIADVTGKKQNSDIQDNKLLKINQEINANNATSVSLKMSISSLESNSINKKEQQESINTELEKLKSQLSETKQAQEICQDIITEKTERKDSINNILNGYCLKIDTAGEKERKLTAAYNEKNEKYYQKSLRLKTLIDMQNNQEGFFGSVKSVSNAAANNKLTGIVGTVAALIKMDSKYTVAIETALGAAVQNIVTENESAAKEAINYLKRLNSGRATFLPLTTIKGRELEDKEIAGSVGVVGVASRLLSYDKKYESIIKYLLGRVCIVETIDNAIALAKKTSHSFKIVTMDGQVMNAGGSMTGGSGSQNMGVLSRAAEIDQLKSEIVTLEADANTAKSALEEHISKNEQIKKDYEKMSAQLSALEIELTKELTSAKHYEVLINGYETGVESYKKQLCESETSLVAAEKDILAAQAQLKQLETEQKALLNEYELLNQNKAQLEKEREQLFEAVNQLKMNTLSLERDIESANQAIEQLNIRRNEREDYKNQKTAELNLIENENSEIYEQIAQIKAEIMNIETEIEQSQKSISDMATLREHSDKKITEIRVAQKDAFANKERLVREAEKLEARKESVLSEYDAIIARLWDEYELTYTEADTIRAGFKIAEDINIQKRIAEIKNQIKALGAVNVEAIEEYKEVKQRYEFLSEQVDDITKAKTDLEKIISDLTEQMRSIFAAQFKVINENFNKVFKELFNGGHASLVLTEPNDILTSGIEINVNPPGKVVKSLQLLSGGEQAFVAIALYFAILKVRPTPFCILDEIEAALDDVNVTKYAQYLRGLCDETQFIVVTHRRGTMEEADVLYGVTMQEKGVSKLLTINVNDVAKQLNIEVN